MTKFLSLLLCILFVSGCAAQMDMQTDDSDINSSQSTKKNYIEADGRPDVISFNNHYFAITSPLQRAVFVVDSWYFFSSEDSRHNLWVQEIGNDDVIDLAREYSSWEEVNDGVEVIYYQHRFEDSQHVTAVMLVGNKRILFQAVNLSPDNLRDIISSYSTVQPI